MIALVIIKRIESRGVDRGSGLQTGYAIMASCGEADGGAFRVGLEEGLTAQVETRTTERAGKGVALMRRHFFN